MDAAAEQLLAEVWNCRACEGLGLPFESPAPGAPFYRFPPTIGATGQASILFVGVNPRVSESNRALHARLASHRAAYRRLARNRIGAQRYISQDGPEGHYRAHLAITESIYPGRPFEDVAAVTELFLCASATARGLPVRTSPCADRFLRRVLDQVQPEVIVAVGRLVGSYFEDRAPGRLGPLPVVTIGGRAVPVVEMPHPNARGAKGAGMVWATAAARAVLAGSEPPRRNELAAAAIPSRRPQATAPHHFETGGALITRVVPWKERYGWRPRHTAGDLRVLEAHPDSTIQHRLMNEGRVVFVLEMTAAELRSVLGSYVDGETWERNGYVTRITNTRGGKPTQEFIERWVPFIRQVEGPGG